MKQPHPPRLNPHLLRKMLKAQNNFIRLFFRRRHRVNRNRCLHWSREFQKLAFLLIERR